LISLFKQAVVQAVAVLLVVAVLVVCVVLFLLRVVVQHI
jgi:hypothetical protein